MSAESKSTQDHEEIRRWVEERDGKPAKVKDTGSQDEGGLLRINFPGFAEENLEEISWEEFFKTFDDRGFSFLYQERTQDGEMSRFFKFLANGGE